MMQGYDMMAGWGGMWFGPIMMFVLPLLIIFLAIWLFRVLVRNGSNAAPQYSPRHILDERYAKGEIDQEEYKSRRQVLEG